MVSLVEVKKKYIFFLFFWFWWCDSIPNQEGRVILPCIGLHHMFCFHGKQPCS